MLFSVLFITAFTVVISQDLLGVSYFFDSNFYNTFSERNCGNATRWDLVSYGYLAMMPPYEASSMSILASKQCCTSSFPIAFFNGTLEISVYIRAIYKDSGITATVFDDEDNVITAIRYNRKSKHFITGWTVISVAITKHVMGYIQLSGRSRREELVIMDSWRYIPDNITIIQSHEKTDTVRKNPDLEKTSITKTFEVEPFLIEFDEINGSGSGDSEEDGNETEESTETATTTNSPTSEEEDTGNPSPEEAVTDNPSSEEGATDNSSSEEEGTNPPSEEENTEDPDETGFWNAFTITFVSVGGFVVVGTVGVGAYYLGKNRGTSENQLLDVDTLEVPSVITVPRVRSMFAGAPTERISWIS